jgi:hypothetical protein
MGGVEFEGYEAEGGFEGDFGRHGWLMRDLAGGFGCGCK